MSLERKWRAFRFSYVGFFLGLGVCGVALSATSLSSSVRKNLVAQFDCLGTVKRVVELWCFYGDLCQQQPFRVQFLDLGLYVAVVGVSGRVHPVSAESTSGLSRCFHNANQVTGANSLGRWGFTFMFHLKPLVAVHARFQAVPQFGRWVSSPRHARS
jgi:hypothetical protein